MLGHVSPCATHGRLNESSARQAGHGALFLFLISPCPQYVVTMENLAAAVTLWIASPTSLEFEKL
jgi:hypothetical protein